MLVFIAFCSGILSGMGIGGGSLFILVSTVFEIISYKEAAFYSLIMFASVGMINCIITIKDERIDKKILFKMILPACVGSLIGTYIGILISEESIRKMFNIFIFLIGIYEIITSLKNIIKAKNNKEERS